MRVVVVCTANLCRSPLAEHVLRRSLLASSTGFEVSSAGVRARSGQRVPNDWAAIARNLGYELDAHEPVALADAPRDADLFLAVTADHARSIALAHPDYVGRIGILGQLAAHRGPHRGFGPSAATVGAQRAIDVLNLPSGHDIPDPFGASIGVQRSIAAHVVEQAERLAECWLS